MNSPQRSLSSSLVLTVSVVLTASMALAQNQHAPGAKLPANTSTGLPRIPFGAGAPLAPGLVPLGIHPPVQTKPGRNSGIRPLTSGTPIFLQTPIYASGGRNAFSVAVDDVNGDGEADLLVANTYSNSVDVLLGNGNGTFQAALSYASGGTNSFSIAIEDVNADGKVDVVVANECADSSCTGGSVGVLLGNGDGTFQTAQAYPSGGLYPVSLAVRDVNGDGKADVMVANECTENTCSAAGNVGVLLGNGDGTFQAAQGYASGGRGTSSVAVGDVNGDGKADLVVANSYDATVGVLVGNGDGTFEPALSYASGGVSTLSVAVGDVNGDGTGDVIVGNSCSDGTCSGGSVGVLLGNGDGTLQAPQLYSSGGGGYFVAVRDVNGDGKADLAVATGQSVGVLLGNGDGTFQASRNFASGGQGAESVATGDVNGDGKIDLVVTNACESTCNSGSVGVLIGNGDGTFQAPPSYASGGQSAISVAAGDVNGDGKPDLVIANECDSRCGGGILGVLLGNGDGTFQPGQNYASGGLYALSVAIGDVNSDGKADLVTANECANGSCGGANVGVLLGNGDGTFQAVQSYATGGFDASWVVVGDVNGDGKPDLVVANSCADRTCAAGTVGVLLGNGDGTFQPAQSFTAALSTESVAIGDVSGDGKPDLVIVNYCADSSCHSSSVGVLFGNGDGTFQAPQSYVLGGTGAHMAVVGDVNGDGKADLVIASQCQSQTDCSNGGVDVLLGNGDGTFQAAQSHASGDIQATSATLGDVNGDGRPDVVVANAFTTGVLLGYGDGTFQAASVYSSGGTSVALGDFNNDGKPDAALSYQASAIVLLNIFAGRQSSTTALTSSVNPSGFNQTVTFTANVTPANGPGTPTGTVTFYDGNNALGSGALASGTAALSTSALGLGPHSITAVYAGDPNFSGSTAAPLNQIVNQTTTTTSLLSAPNPSVVNQSVLFTATVTGQFGGAPTGTVSFIQNGKTLGTGTLSGGQATLNYAFGRTGTISVTAAYSGDLNFLSSTSAPLQQVVKKAPSTTTVASSQNPSSFNQLVTFTATVSSSFGNPLNGEVVTFLDGTSTLGTGTLSGGVATLTTSGLATGAHQIRAKYAGDADFMGSTSAALQQRVNKAASTTALVSSQNPSSFGQSVTFTATLSGQYGGTPTGTVTFKDGTTVLGMVSLSGGSAAYSTSTLSKGKHNIVAAYGGDSNFKPSSRSLVQKVQ